MDIDTIILSGGGIKGIAILGCLNILYQVNKLEINTYSGTSIGGLLCFLLNIGYNPKELIEINNRIEWEKIQNIDFDNLLDNWSLSSFIELEKLIIKQIENKNYSREVTFKELNDKTKKKLILTGSNITKSRIEYFSWESTPYMKIVDALKITMNFPIIFPPIKYENNLYVDGGLICNYPIEVVKYNKKKLGFYLGDDLHNEHTNEINNIIDYVKTLFTIAHNKYSGMDYINYKKETVIINIKNIFSMDFSLNQKMKNNLVKMGEEIMIEFIKKIDK